MLCVKARLLNLNHENPPYSNGVARCETSRTVVLQSNARHRIRTLPHTVACVSYLEYSSTMRVS